MEKDIYIVVAEIGSWGEYNQYYEECRKAFFLKEDANEYVLEQVQLNIPFETYRIEKIKIEYEKEREYNGSVLD